MTSRTVPDSPREHLERRETRCALVIQNQILVATRELLAEGGFVELLPPVIGPVTDPGIRGSKQVDIDYYGHRYKLMTSAILYKQASLLSFGKIFYIAPNVRLEPPETSSTNRHLTEFHQIDVEVAGARQNDAMQLAEDLVVHVVRRVIERALDELTALGRDPDALAGLSSAPFDRITHATAVADLTRMGYEQSRDAEINWPAEEQLSRKASRPFFVTDYPKGSRGFYDRENPDSPGLLRNFDLIAPEGFGELASGSEREFDYARLIARMRETGENPAKYSWYLAMARDGIPSSAGFGLGAQRLTRYVSGLEAIWQATAYPKLPGVISP